MIDTDFEKVCMGTLNPQTAFVQGKMKIKGNMKKATLFTPELFPKPTPENRAKYSSAKLWYIHYKDVDQLKDELLKSKKELLELRVSKKSNSNEKKVSQIKVVRKNIARILTSLRHKEIQAKRKDYEGKTLIPKSLRPKLTKKLRNELTPSQVNRVTRRRRVLNKL